MRDDDAIVSFRAPAPTLETFERFLAGEGTADEVEQVRAWAGRLGATGTSPADDLRAAIAVYARNGASDVARTQQILRERLSMPKVSPARKRLPGAWGNGAREDQDRSLEKRVGASGTQILRGWGKFVGIVGFVAFVGMFLMLRPSHNAGVTRTYATTVGQRAVLVLDDGTHVMLAPQTTLRLVRFNQRSRTIVLDGDAYFEVAPLARTPFVVQTGMTTTRVLGTAFEVRHYGDDKEVRIAVATGKVVVSSGVRYPAVSVTAGHVASVIDSIPTVKAVDNIDSEIGWLGDQLVFQDAPMVKILATLTRWYGYQFRCTDSSVVKQNITIGLSMRSSTEALASLEQILNVSLTVTGDTVTLTPVRGHTSPNQRSKHYDVWIPTREVGR